MKPSRQLAFVVVLQLIIAGVVVGNSYLSDLLELLPPSSTIPLVYIISILGLISFFIGGKIILRQTKNEWETLETKMKFAFGILLAFSGVALILNSVKMLLSK